MTFTETIHRDPQQSESLSGISLRDWFAGQALAGFASLERDTPMETEAKLAYKYADAMLAERQRSKPYGNESEEKDCIDTRR